MLHRSILVSPCCRERLLANYLLTFEASKFTLKLDENSC